MPTLTIIAGPNGAGKTKFSNLLYRKKIIPSKVFNLDFLDDKIYEQISHDPLRAKKQVDQIRQKLFLKECEEAIREKAHFSYECNFRKDQLRFVGLFEEAGYTLNVIFFFLDDIKMSRKRVKMRLKTGGKNIDEESLNENFSQSLANLDFTFEEWDNLYLINNCTEMQDENSILRFSLIAEKGNILHINDVFPPKKVQYLIPEIMKQVTSIRS